VKTTFFLDGKPLFVVETHEGVELIESAGFLIETWLEK
jgi:hypothetical protein